MSGDKFKYENSLEDEMVEMVHIHEHVKRGEQFQLGLEPRERTAGWGEGEDYPEGLVYGAQSSSSYELASKSVDELMEDPHIANRWDVENFYGETGQSEYVWTNKKDPKLTVNMHTYWSENEDDEGNSLDDVVGWYVYPAYAGRGIPNSPYTTDTEEDALREARKLLHMSRKELM